MKCVQIVGTSSVLLVIAAMAVGCSKKDNTGHPTAQSNSQGSEQTVSEQDPATGVFEELVLVSLNLPGMT